MYYGNSKIWLILKTLPEKPGVYRFFDENGKILYVGKAKKLKRRVSSYFNKQHEPGKLRVLVSKVADIQTTIVNSEWEALLLENNMIKEFRPRYNIMLKDDKTYPWIAISKEDYPRIYPTRNPDREHNLLFGPYPSVYYMNVLLDTIKNSFPLRTCKRLIKSERPCIQYQIKKCAAPCAGMITMDDYQKNIASIIQIIKGNSKMVIHQLKEEMMKCADQWEFEKAQDLKERIKTLETYVEKSVVVNPEISRLDVFSIAEAEDVAAINYLHIIDGAIIQAYTLEIGNKWEKTKEELLSMGIMEIKERFGEVSKEIVLPFLPDTTQESTIFTIPKRGDKKKLLDLSEKNAKFYLLEKKKKIELVNPERHHQRILNTLKDALGMDVLPTHIECFDNSNTGGEEPVAAMVCFLNGKPAKKEYRHYNIKTVVGADDFASMEEVVYRRYSRLLEEKKELPELIVIDGGKGQLHAAYKALVSLKLENTIMIIGIAKRLEDIYKVGDELPVYLDKKSEAQYLIQQLRDEVHRFGITHHRKKRAKKSIQSSLDNIPGIGRTLKDRLLLSFKSVKRIEAAGETDLAKVIGPAKAHTVYTFYHQE